VETKTYNIEKDMTIFNAAQLKPELMRAVKDEKVDAFNLSHVNEIDSAGFQLLALAKTESEKLGKSLQIVDCSVAVIELMVLFGKRDWCSAK
jgi:ABC-type transporter Mla MlaB component